MQAGGAAVIEGISLSRTWWPVIIFVNQRRNIWKHNMNTKSSIRVLRYGLCIAAALVAGGAASGETMLTFQVDMSQQIAFSQFVPGVDQVWVQGSFNGWGQLVLTNDPAAPNTNLYTGSVDDTADGNGSEMSYLFGDSEIPYETTADYNNRAIVLPTASGAHLTVPYTYFDDNGPTVANQVTLQVDMSGEINCGNFVPGVSTVEVRGNFEGWSGGATMNPDPTILRTNYQGVVSSNVYVLSLPVEFSTNAACDFKYVIQPNTVWESPASTNQDSGGNRWFVNSSNQTLPVVYFNDVPIYVSNNITFEVDMTAQIEGGGFMSGYNWVEVHGDFDGWSYGQVMSNPNPATPDIYSASVTYIDVPGAQHYFKYVVQPGPEWETVSPDNAIGGDRYLNLAQTNGMFTNGPVYFSDVSPSSLPYDTVNVPNCMVTFTVDMTGAAGPFGPFNPELDQVELNGLYNGMNDTFWTWGYFNAPAQYVMSEIGNSMLYTLTVPVNEGQSLDLLYKYGIDGLDDEAGFLNNHERWIRSLPNYTMPTDTFGSQGATTQAEPRVGNLSIGVGGGRVNLSWIGGMGIHVQTTSKLNPGTVWTNLLFTDGTNLPVGPGGAVSTNFPFSPGNHFYRLAGPE
jgi:hypothetical protein